MTPKTTTDDLFAPLGLAVFERLPTGLFQAVGHLPAWLPVKEDSVDLAGHFPILEIFLPECEALWQAGGPAPMQSDVWTEPDHAGGEIYLQAVAAAAGGRHFIALRSLPAALFTYQQLAHDFELEKEKVERLSHELEAKRREAERATQAKSDFLATMSHEIRTPLNAIIGMADVLSSTSLTGEQKKCVDIFQRNGVALLNLINDILDLSRVESGHVELEATDLDLREVVARAMEVVEVRATAKGLSLRQTIAPDVPRYLIGDPNRLRQIIINLLGNSIKFTDHGGLEVKVEPDPENTGPGRLRFAITDTGIGIPEDKLGLIFESFSQADSSTTRRYGGTGLGLTISKQLVELMDGRIWVESQVGVGSTFFFTARFQVQQDQSERTAQDTPQTTHASLAELEARAAGLRILLVDDSEDNRILILSYLKKTRSTIDIAEDGQRAVEFFRTGHYDVVLMDVEMPVMDGYQATREIRRIEKESGAPPTPVLALTAHAFAEMKVKGYEAGFTDLLTKPIRQTTLLEALAKHGSSGGSGSSEAERPVVAPASIRIRVEEGMEDVVPGYLAKRRAEVAVYRERLGAGDFDAIRKLAHKMKGTGGGYGFPKLTELGAALEKGAIQSDTSAIRENLDEFALYLESVKLEYLS
jgi:signal transduction histidine kinase/CheY-like chemotaxis protein/HPt (histidine-containing phosphotransfer) domain-containing protein